MNGFTSVIRNCGVFLALPADLGTPICPTGGSVTAIAERGVFTIGSDRPRRGVGCRSVLGQHRVDLLACPLQDLEHALDLFLVARRADLLRRDEELAHRVAELADRVSLRPAISHGVPPASSMRRVASARPWSVIS